MWRTKKPKHHNPTKPLVEQIFLNFLMILNLYKKKLVQKNDEKDIETLIQK